MSPTTRWLCCSLALLIAPSEVQAQGFGRGTAGLATFSHERSAAGGLISVQVRPYDRIRVAVAVAGLADLSGGPSPVGRAEALAQFQVTPYQLTGWGVYAAGGLAVEVQERTRGVARIVFALGVERAPAAPRSLFIEGGLGGGWRVALGVRWRPRGRRRG